MTAEIAGALAAIDVSADARERLELFVARFLERNARTNLSAARDAAAVAAHVADSLSIAHLVREPLVDIGSGGGFPALVIAIATGMRMTLVEATAKKARFLEEIANDLGLAVKVRAERAEDAARDPRLRGAFASATARAVSSAPTVLELTIPFLEIGGIAVLQRGKLEGLERIAATDAALVLGAEVVNELPIGNPADASDERRVLLVRKVAATGQRFPRRAGIPAKRPLCLAESERA